MRKRICKEKKILEGIAFCGVCGRVLEVETFTRDGKEYARYACRSGCVRPIRVDELNEHAWAYMNGLADQAFQEKLIAGFQALDSERIEREVSIARQKAEALMDDLAILRKRPEVVRVPDELGDWLDRPLPDRSEMIRQAEEAARSYQTQSYNIEEYFSVAFPEKPGDDPKQARKAVSWYIERIMVQETKLEFGSTLDNWLKGKDYRWREKHRIAQWPRKD